MVKPLITKITVFKDHFAICFNSKVIIKIKAYEKALRHICR